jgi:uncharacterized protein (DUF4213/DUF364 family)
VSEILKEIIAGIGEDRPVADVSIYLHAVAVDGLRLGLCSAFGPRSAGEPRGRDEVVANEGRLTDFTARQLAEYALSAHWLEASVGVAAINSAIELNEAALEEGNGVELVMELASGKGLAVVGHFPFTEQARGKVREMWVLELDPKGGDLPAGMAPEVIPRADVVAITGTTLVNHTLDGLLGLARGKKVVVLGPSAILSPILFQFGVFAVCGVVVDDKAAVIRQLKEGGSLRRLPGARQVILHSPRR